MPSRAITDLIVCIKRVNPFCGRTQVHFGHRLEALLQLFGQVRLVAEWDHKNGAQLFVSLFVQIDKIVWSKLLIKYYFCPILIINNKNNSSEKIHGGIESKSIKNSLER